MQMIDRNTLNLAGEFAVASELCRRGIYAQLTLGPHKRTDLLVETDSRMLRIQVKAKQRAEWPGHTGVQGDDVVLVLVDFSEKGETDRPDYYVLTAGDWGDIVRRGPRAGVNHGPQPGSWKLKKVGVAEHLERWDKVARMLEL